MAHAKSTEQAAIFAVTRNLAVVNGAVALLIVAAAYLMALPPADLIRLALAGLAGHYSGRAARDVYAVGRLRRADCSPRVACC